MNPYFHSFAQQFTVMGFHSVPPALVAVFVTVGFALIVWSLAWEGVALWHSARNRQWIWFVVFLLIHTLGILEIIYLLFFRMDKNGPKGGMTTGTATTPPMTSPVSPATGTSSSVA